ncbi:hypothetical protein, partial [Mesorhizobium sp. M5C.F.Ca.IN.020.29.1.1]|uniref:hypothetical protein n=1 Tax=Mesorhizobium sp. M5C.F.Ca.IN.020.29.1.1 TaxID=2496770 RepID=UPI0019CFF689
HEADTAGDQQGSGQRLSVTFETRRRSIPIVTHVLPSQNRRIPYLTKGKQSNIVPNSTTLA